jgi:hypothetical protein
VTSSRGRRRAWSLVERGVLSVVLLGLAGPPAWAAPAAPSASPTAEARLDTSRAPEPDKEQARALFREGLSLLDAERYAKALECFERAYAAWNNPKILLNIATAQRALGQLARAANNYALYQRTAAPEPTRSDEVTQLLATLDAGLGRLVFFNTDAEQRVWLNDEELTVAAGQEIRVEPGEYSLRIAHPRRPADARTIAVWPGELLRVDASQPRAPKPVPSVPPRDEPERETASATARGDSRVFVLARADVDVARRGAVGAVGVAVAVQDFLRLTGGALLGAHRGGWLGVELLPSRHWIAPVLGLSAPLFFVEGARPGGSAELGLRVEVSRRLAPFARVSVTHFPHVPADYVRTLIIPSVGLEAGL